jgi:hypothetical protein
MGFASQRVKKSGSFLSKRSIILDLTQQARKVQPAALEHGMDYGLRILVGVHLDYKKTGIGDPVWQN